MTDVYKIGVEIALVGTIVQGLETVAKWLTGINTKVKDVEGGITRWGLAVGGAAALIGAAGIADGLAKAVNAGGELVKQQTLLKNMGVSWADVVDTTNKAQLATQQVVGTTISENIKGMRELMGVMPNLEEAQAKYPAIMQAAKVLESLTGTPADNSMQILAKAIELRGGGINPKTGQLDPDRLAREAEAATKAIIASGGLVNAQSLLQMMQQAGPMTRMVTDADTFYKGIITAMMDMGGARAGTALTAVGRQLLGGKMTKPTAEEMEAMGLLVPGMWHKSGTGVFVDKGGLVGEDILKDPQKGIASWMSSVMLPALSQHGITSPADIQQELYRVFGTETARRMAGLFIQNQSQIERDAKLYDNALGSQAYGNVAGGDLAANTKNFSDAFQNLLQALGSPMVAPAIQGLQTISNAINAVAASALANPTVAKGIGEALTAIVVGLTGAGVVAIGSLIVAAAPFAAAITGIVAAAGVLVAFNWKWLWDQWITITSAANMLAGVAWQKITDVLQGIYNAIYNFVTKIGALAGALGGIGSGSTSPGATVGGLVGPKPGGGGKSFWHLPTGKELHDAIYGTIKPMSYVPPSGGSAQPVVVHTALNVDGRTLAKTVGQYMAKNSSWSNNSSTFDGSAMPPTTDMSFA